VESNKQRATHESATPENGNEPREKPIRLNDLIPKRDVKGGRRAVFGAIRARPANNKPKKEPQP